MTLSIQTCCPHCFSCFNLPAEQLDQSQAKGRCGQCQQVFLVNEHLIVSAKQEKVLVQGDVAQKHTTEAIDNEYSIADQNDIETVSDYSGYNFENGAYKVANYSNTGFKSFNLDNTNLNSSSTTETMVLSDSIDDKPSAVDYDESDVWQSLIDQAIATDTKNVTPHQTSTIIGKPSSPNTVSAPTTTSKIAPDTVTEPLTSVSATAVNHSKTVSNSFDTINTSIESELPTQTNAAPHLTQLLTNKSASSGSVQSSTEAISKIQTRIQQSSTNAQTSIASILWLAGCLVLMLLLFAQYIIFNLNTLIKNPAHAARLQTVCSIVICSLPNADLSKLSITDLSYRSSRVNTNDNFSDIKANLVNTDTQAQLLPSLKVSVYNTDGLLGSFIAVPDDYLLSSQNQLAGKAHQSVMFTVPIAVQHIHQVRIDAIY